MALGCTSATATRCFAATTSTTTTEGPKISRRQPTPAAMTSHLLFLPLSAAGTEKQRPPMGPANCPFP
jgi:hypothetical protein